MRFKYYCSEAWKNISRYERAGISAVLIVAILMSVMGVFTWVAYNVDYTRKMLSREMGILVFMKDGTLPEMPAIMEKIKTIPGVESVDMITRDQALQEFSNNPQIKQEVMILGFNPLPDTIEIKTQSAFSPGKLKSIADTVLAIPGVEKVDYGQESISNIITTLESVQYFIVLVGTVLTVITFILAYIGVQMTFTDRVKDSEILQSLGASAMFIRAPILIESVLYGILGSVMSLSFLFAIHSVTKLRIDQVVFIPKPTILILFVAGILLSFVGTLLESFRHIKLK
jgi:cell division transport system permease protein